MVLYAKDNACFISVWFHCEHHAFVVFFTEPACFEEGNGRPTVLTGDGTCPEVGDGGLTVYIGVETGKVSYGLLQHPPAPGPDMPRKIGLDRGYFRLNTDQLWLRCLVPWQAKGGKLYLQGCSLKALGFEIGFHKFA